MGGPGVPRPERLKACLLLGSGAAEKALAAHCGFSPSLFMLRRKRDSPEAGPHSLSFSRMIGSDFPFFNPSGLDGFVYLFPEPTPQAPGSGTRERVAGAAEVGGNSVGPLCSPRLRPCDLQGWRPAGCAPGNLACGHSSQRTGFHCRSPGWPP